MGTQLSKDADKLLCILYKKYYSAFFIKSILTSGKKMYPKMTPNFAAAQI